MSRPYRLQAEDTLYHVICRGDDRKPIFMNERDYERYLGYLEVAKERYGVYLYAYVLMTNHVHLLVETSLPNISQIMHYINTSYTTYFNVKYRRSGHLFQGRYKSVIVDKDFYLLELTRYIHLNPVRAKMVKLPEEYTWSSYREFIKPRKKGLISKDKLRHYISNWGPRYRSYVEAGIGMKMEFARNIYAGFIMGGAQFIRETLNELKIQVESESTSYANDLMSPYDLDEILDGVGEYYKVSEDTLCQSKNKAMKEKKVAIFMAKRLTSASNPEIGKRFGITYSVVSKAAKSVEEEMKNNRRLRKDLDKLFSSFKG